MKDTQNYLKNLIKENSKLLSAIKTTKELVFEMDNIVNKFSHAEMVVIVNALKKKNYAYANINPEEMSKETMRDFLLVYTLKELTNDKTYDQLIDKYFVKKDLVMGGGKVNGKTA